VLTLCDSILSRSGMKWRSGAVAVLDRIDKISDSKARGLYWSQFFCRVDRKTVPST
jgi:hypothetical protein